MDREADDAEWEDVDDRDADGEDVETGLAKEKRWISNSLDMA